MLEFIALAIAAVALVVVGILIYRKNGAKIESEVVEAKSTIDDISKDVKKL